MPRNSTTDLTNHIFEQIERLKDEDCDLDREIRVSKELRNMEKIDIKYFKFLLLGTIISTMMSMCYGYRFGVQDSLKKHVNLYSQKHNRLIYVSRDTSTHLMWVNDTLYFLPK